MIEESGRLVRAALWVLAYISFSMWVIVEDIDPALKFLVFGAINLFFMSTIVDDGPEEEKE